MNNKRAPPKKKAVSSNSSNQKENRPKKAKVAKPDPNDAIGMSKQLVTRKSIQKLKRKPNSKSKNRVCGNGKVMPTLADLEKMYEDSESDKEKSVEPNVNLTEPVIQDITPESNNTIIDTDLLLSPSTRLKITEYVKSLLNTEYKETCNADTLEPSPEKRRKLNTSESECLIQQVVITTLKEDSTFKTHDEKEGHKDVKIDDLTQSTNVESLCTSKDLVEENFDNNSIDSDKTIEYEFAPPQVQNESVSQLFCPLPSTSKDNVTFIKNDELFNLSLKKENNEKSDPETTSDENLPIEDQENDVEIIEIPTETITIDDEVIEEPQNNIKNEDQIHILDSPDHNNSTNNTNNSVKSNYDYDDDCVFVGETQNGRQTDKQEIIDLDYASIEPMTNNLNNSDHVNNEIIDVDALIAQNKTILGKYQDSDPNNLDNSILVVDADITTIEPAEAPNITVNNEQNQSIYQYNPDVSQAPNTAEPSSSATYDVNQNFSEPDLLDISDSVPHRSRRSSYHRSRRHNSHTHTTTFTSQSAQATSDIIAQEVSDFFSSYESPEMPEGFARAIQPFFNLVNKIPVLFERLMDGPGAQGNVQIRLKKKTKKKSRSSPSQPTPNDVPPLSGESRQSGVSSSGNLGDCPICMDLLSGKTIASTICGHVFCMNCLKQAIKANKRCPTCRKVIKSNGYHQIFL